MLAFMMSATAWAGRDLLGIYLTWHGGMDPARSIAVNWVDLFPGSSQLVWVREAGAGDDAPWRRVQGEAQLLEPSTLMHRRAMIDDLQPDTLHVLRIGDDPSARRITEYRFRTMPQVHDRPIRFVNGGDMMHRRAWVDAMNQQAGRLDPDFALIGGDFAYADGWRASRWVDWLQSWMQHAVTTDGRLIPIVAGIGNHEVDGGYNRTPAEAPFFYRMFVLPGERSYFALDFGDDLSIIVLDSDHTEPVDGEQTRWLAAALSERDERRWLIACYHFPAWGTTKAPEGGLPSDHRVARRIRTHWVPLLEKHRVSIVFEHDHHNYKRTHRIREDRRDDVHGILYMGDGSWGVSTRSVPAPGEAWYLAHAEPTRHLILGVLHPDGTAQFDALTAGGERIDGVVLERSRPLHRADPVSD